MNKELPLVSIVTPSYNKGRFIEETILSVRNQTYPHIEHIIVDGGSTDGTQDILRKYNNSITWISEPDEGQSDAINKGWRMSHGEILAYLNADDTYMPWAVETAVGFFTEHPDVSMVYGDCAIINEHGEVTGQCIAEDFNLGKSLCGPPNVIPQPAAFLRRVVIDKVGYLDTNLHFAMDLDLWIRIGLKFRMYYIPQVLANFREYPGTKTLSEVNPFWRERCVIVDKTFSNPGLPREIRRLKRQAYGKVNRVRAELAFRAGRMALIDGHWGTAKRNFMGALSKGPIRIKLGALLGLACAYCKLDFEWIATITGKPNLK